MRSHMMMVTSSALGAALTLLTPVIASTNCDFTTFLDLQRQWNADDEPCQQTLTFDLWLVMKAEGSADDPDAKHVLAECVNLPPVGRVQLSVGEGWEYTPSGDDCGEVIVQGKSAAAFSCRSVADLEAMCEDAGILRATRINAVTDGRLGHERQLRGTTSSSSRRSLQLWTSEAGQVHEVDLLIEGLRELGCANTQGEGQTLCVMSDSFDWYGEVSRLQAQGDLPPVVDIVKEFELEQGEMEEDADVIDEGSAMMELAYDIAPNSIYKFHTAKSSYELFAEAVTTMSTAEDCDVIVDDIRYPIDPTFRDGPLSQAIDTAVEDENILYFTAVGNTGYGIKEAFDLACVDIFGDGTTSPPCSTGIATHVFDESIEPTSNLRYATEFNAEDDGVLALSWDDDLGVAGVMAMALWYSDAFGNPVQIFEVSLTESPAYPVALMIVPSAGKYFVSVHLLEEREETALPFQLWAFNGGGTFPSANGPSITGMACAEKCISVAAIDHEAANGGVGDVFSDPETASVQEYSARGGCTVRNDAGDLQERLKPTTTAADSLATSPNRQYLTEFPGTSAAAPVAAAIATLVRAACAPERMVGFDDMMEMLSNPAYTIDYTADEEVSGEMWGTEAGYGIVSASQMLEWVKLNCVQACPGATQPTPAVPTPAPFVNTSSPTTGMSPTTTVPGRTPPPSFFTPMPTEAALTPPELAVPATPSPTDRNDGYVDASTRTTVKVAASGYDDRPSAEGGCGTDGCLPELARDGVISDEGSRWSCMENIVVPGMDNCEIEFKFTDPQDIARLEVAFWKWDTRTRRLKVAVNGETVGSFDSASNSEVTSYGIDAGNVKKLKLESLGLDKDEWVSLLEVRILVTA